MIFIYLSSRYCNPPVEMEEFLMTDDKELLLRISQGDETAFSTLFGRYRNRLYHYLVKVLKSEPVAEEAVLDVFMKIWKARNALTALRSFEAFIFQVARNQAIDYMRSLARTPSAQQETWELIQDLVAQETTDQRLLTRETEQKIQDSVRRLSPQRQEVFRLSREENLSYEEIARRMQLSRLTVRNHMLASLKFIRGRMENGQELALLLWLCLKNY